IFVHKMSIPLNDAILEYDNSNTIFIYPNPSNGIYNIAFSSLKEKAIIEVYNSIGALVYRKETMSGQTIIELTNQVNGLYCVKVICGNKIIGAQKIIKQ
ncbi:MAG: T9SS type A sorting domain-containing protein, partial [Bacteroidetes bacterium]|nr:T9SS type A sorting domain-containing protein [Bacteroidota bacterium]